MVRRVPVRTSPGNPFNQPQGDPVATSAQAPLVPCQAAHCTENTPPPVPPPDPGLQPAPSVELDAPVGVSCARAEMSLVLVAHEGL